MKIAKVIRKIGETLMEKLILLCGGVTIIFVILIFVFLLRYSLPALRVVPLFQILAGKDWYPGDEAFGILAIIWGSLLTTVGAIIVAVPIGVAVAIYIGEVAHKRIRETLKPVVEILAAIPSVVIGFLGLVLLVPVIQNVLKIDTGMTALTGAIMLAFMAMPTIISISEDALHAVPQQYREASLAMGATKWQTIWRVVVPAARSGIVASVMLGVGRAIGETMTVLMVTGNATAMPEWSHGLGFLQPMRTLTATIAAEMGEAVDKSTHYYVLFVIGAVLFVITFFVNFMADLALHRTRR